MSIKATRSIYKQYIFTTFLVPVFLIIVLLSVGIFRYVYLKNYRSSNYFAESKKVEEILKISFEYIYEFSRIAGNKIRNLREVNGESVANVLKETISLSNMIQDVFHLNIFDFTTPEGIVIATTTEGKLLERVIVDPTRRSWMNLAPKEPWKIHISSPDLSIMSNRAKINKIIPIGFGITDKNNKFLGSLSVGIDANQMNIEIRRSIDNNLDYILLSDKYEYITSSINIKENDYLNNFLKKVKDNTKIDFQNYRFEYIQNIESYPFIILLGKNKAILEQEFKNIVLPDVVLALAIGSFITILLFFFKNKIVKPIIVLSERSKELSRGNIEITFPSANSVEEEMLIEALYMVKESFIREIDAKNRLANFNKELEKNVKDRTEELEIALAAKTEFLNNMSHEVRTPVQGVNGIAVALVDGWKKFSEDEKLYFAKKVAENSNRLFTLVSNLLDLSRMSMNKMKFLLSDNDLVILVKDMIGECVDLYIGVKNIKVIYDNDGKNKAIIECDKERIIQVLRNLFANAIKFTEEGTITASIIDAEIISDQVYIDAYKFIIKDEGIGIPPEEEDDIFTPFVQSTRTKTKAGGTGLGLAICKDIIEGHGGFIKAKANNIQGTIIEFTIPKRFINHNGNIIIEKEKTDEELWNEIEITDETKKNSEELKDDNNKVKKTILIIDDEESARMSLSLMVVASGYEYIEAACGTKGLELLIKHKDEISLVMLDLMMPDIDGVDLFCKIKSDDRISSIPVILQTGTNNDKELDRARKSGLNNIINKPYNKDDIDLILKNILV